MASSSDIVVEAAESVVPSLNCYGLNDFLWASLASDTSTTTASRGLCRRSGAQWPIYVAREKDEPPKQTK